MTMFTRRSILKAIGASSLLSSQGLLASKAFAGERDDQLNILCWEGYNSADVLDPYRRLRSAEVKAESATNDPTMVNKLRAAQGNSCYMYEIDKSMKTRKYRRVLHNRSEQWL